MNFIGMKYSGGNGKAYSYEYTAKEDDNKVIIEAKMIINKESKTALNFIEKANKKNTSPLTMILKEEEREMKRRYIEDAMK